MIGRHAARSIRVLLVSVALIATAFAPAPARASGCEVSGKLVVYTSQLEKDAKATANTFTRVCPGVDLEWVRAPTRRLLEMLAVELTEGAPQADVVMLSDAIHLLPLKLDGRLLPLPDIDVTQFEPGLYDPDRTFFATKLVTTVIVGRRGSAPPDNWQGLEKVSRHMSLAFPMSLRSTAATNHLLGLLQVPELGWRHFEQLSAAGVQPNSTFGRAIEQVAAGEADLGLTVDFLAVDAIAAGAPIEAVFPRDGSPVYTEPIAALNASNNPAAARAFVAFVLSESGQAMIRSHGFIPARSDMATPNGYPPREEIMFVIPDSVAALRDGTAIREQFTSLFPND